VLDVKFFNVLRPEIEIIIRNVNKTYYAFIPLLQSQSVLRAQKVKPCKKLTRPMAKYGAESWTVSRDIAKTAGCF